jgi:hypothetical protein
MTLLVLTVGGLLAAADGGYELRIEHWLDTKPLSPDKPAVKPVRPPFKWDVPDLVEYVNVPGITMADMVPVRFNAAISKQDVKTLAQHYVKKFAEAGFYLPPRDRQMELEPGAVQVTGLDTQTLISYVAILKPIDARNTRVLMAEAAMQAFVDSVNNPGAAPGDFAPIMPGAQSTVRSSTEGTKMITFTTPEPEAAVKAFYRQTLVSAGYQAVADGYKKGDELITLSAVRHDRETWVMLRRLSSR